jgi:uncharacterized protein (TIGR02145 family)
MNCINTINKLSMTKYLVFLFLISSGILFSQKAPFVSVKIGTQTWMSANLNVDKFRNGDVIPEAKSIVEWEMAGEEGRPVWCYYENKKKNGKKYGKLYNFYAVNDPRGLAPEGWHVPSESEWIELENCLGGYEIAAKKLKSKSGWYEKGNGTDDFGFSAFPGGYRQEGTFQKLTENGIWWSKEDNATYFFIHYGGDNIGQGGDESKQDGFSVRCIKD